MRTNLEIEPQDTLQYQYVIHGPCIAVRFVVGVIDKLKEEVWNCRMRPICRTENGTKFLDIVSNYFIKYPSEKWFVKRFS